FNLRFSKRDLAQAELPTVCVEAGATVVSAVVDVYAKAFGIKRSRSDARRSDRLIAMSKRVLIISASAGTGHVRAGQALEKAFGADPQVSEVRHADALDYTNKVFRDFYSKLYLKLVRSAPNVLGWVYRASDEPWKG